MKCTHCKTRFEHRKQKGAASHEATPICPSPEKRGHYLRGYVQEILARDERTRLAREAAAAAPTAAEPVIAEMDRQFAVARTAQEAFSTTFQAHA